MKVNIEVIRKELVLLLDKPIWCNWKNINGRKVPTPHVKQPGLTFDQAVARLTSVCGLGIFLGDLGTGHHLVGADLDNCRAADGATDREAWVVVQRLKSYAEYSPSGSGIKALGLVSRLPDVDGTEFKPPWKAAQDNGHGAEIAFYRAGRFFALTGDRCGDDALRVFTDTYAAVASCYGRPVEPVGPPAPVASETAQAVAPVASETDQAAEAPAVKAEASATADVVELPPRGDISDQVDLEAYPIEGNLRRTVLEGFSEEQMLAKSKRSGAGWGWLCEAVRRGLSPELVGAALLYVGAWVDGAPKGTANTLRNWNWDNGDDNRARWRHANSQYKNAQKTVASERAQAAAVASGKLIFSYSDPYGVADRLWDALWPNKTLRRYRGEFFEWRDGYWRPLPDEAVSSRVATALRSGIDDGNKPFLPNRKQVAEVVAALSHEARLLDGSLDAPFWIEGDQPGRWFPLANGLLDLDDGGLIPTTQDYFNLFASGVTFDGGTRCDAWLKFLATQWADDPESVATLQEWFGYYLSGETGQEKLQILLSPPRGGKGTIAWVLRQLLGESNVVGASLGQLQQADMRGLAPFIGKPLAVFGEARLSGRDDITKITETLLGITGRDKVSIPRKYLANWNGVLPTRFLLLGNLTLGFNDASAAIASRLSILKMPHSFVGKEDRGLRDRLMAELPGILNWAIEGYRRWKARGGDLAEAASGAEALRDMKDMASPLTRFVRERCELGEGRRVGVDVLYATYVDWCGPREPKGREWFGRDLMAAFPSLKRRQPLDLTGRQSPVYEGIWLQPVVFEDPQMALEYAAAAADAPSF